MTGRLSIALHGARLEGLELILAGLLPGVDGYRLPDAGADVPHLWIPSGEGIASGEEIQLCDSENTPLASLRVDESADAAARTWVSGRLRQLRVPEHGPARDARLSADDDLAESVVAVFSPGASPADVLRAVREAGERPLVLVAEGVPDRVRSAQLASSLRDVADLVPHSRVYFVPDVDLGSAEIDATSAVLAGRGAAAFLDFRAAGVESDDGSVILFTGLSGSGKSTIARALADRVGARSSRRVVLLDGDHVRRELASELGFSAEDRHRNLLRQAWVGARVAEAGGVAICAPIAPFARSRAAMRAKVEPASRFFLIYVSTPLSVAEERDRKGLYAKARAGIITDFTGIGSPYEVPGDADLTLDASRLSVDECVDRTMDFLARQNVI